MSYYSLINYNHLICYNPILAADAAELADSFADQGEGVADKPRSWPLLLFFAVVLGGPYLIWSYMKPTPAAQKDFRQPVRARAAFDYDAQAEDELSFRMNDILKEHPPEPNETNTTWLRASLHDRQVN